MNIKDEDAESDNYAIISYSHASKAAVKNELRAYDDKRICYWFDESMRRGESYETQFREKMDRTNCKGVIFFISERFLLSGPCGDEMRYYFEKYKNVTESPGKFCLFVLPQGFPHRSSEMKKKVEEYLKNSLEEKEKKEKILENNIDLYQKLSMEGKAIGVRLGDKNDLDKCCESGEIFNRSSELSIMFGRTDIKKYSFGYFPQNRDKKAASSGIEKERVKRALDGAMAYYAKVDWIIVSEDERSATLLSKDLLFTIDYLNLKYPLKDSGEKISEIVKKKFISNFRCDGESWKLKEDSIRFLNESELITLTARAFRYPKEKQEVLLPNATYFSQMSNNVDAPKFWLAVGDDKDMNNARRVDPYRAIKAARKKREEAKPGEDQNIHGLSEMETSVERFYVRVVIDVNKE